MTDLKPCPFCGGEVRIGETEFDPGVLFFECDDCGVYVEPNNSYADERKAIEAWNTRYERTCNPVLSSERDGMPYLEPQIVCSECGCILHESMFGVAWQRYCPKCGARIRKVDE